MLHGKRFNQSTIDSLEEIRVGLYANPGTVGECALSADTFFHVLKACRSYERADLSVLVFSLIQIAVRNKFALKIYPLHHHQTHRTDAYYRAYMLGEIDIAGELFSYTPARSEYFQYYKVMVYQPYFLLMSRQHVRHFESSIRINLLSEGFIAVAILLAIVSAFVRVHFRSKSDPPGSKPDMVGQTLFFLLSFTNQHTFYRRRCAISVAWLFAALQFYMNFNSLFRVGLIPKRQLTFEGSLSLADDIMAGNTLLVHDSKHWSYFNHLLHPKNRVQRAMNASLEMHPLIETKSHAKTLWYLSQSPVYVTFYDFDLKADDATHVIKEDDDLPPRPMFLTLPILPPGQKREPKISRFLDELDKGMDEIIPLIDRFNAKRIAKVDHYMLPTSTVEGTQPKPLNVTTLLNVLLLFLFGATASMAAFFAESLSANVRSIAEDTRRGGLVLKARKEPDLVDEWLTQHFARLVMRYDSVLLY